MLPALLISAVVIQQPEWLLAKEHVRVRFPATAPISNRPRASLRSRISKIQRAWGSTTGACQIHSWGRDRQVMHLPCKQAHAGALPTDSTISLRGE